MDRRSFVTGLVGAGAAAAAAAAAAEAAAAAPAPSRAGMPPAVAPARAGARNLITDVAGLKVGQAEDMAVRTGVTVIMPDKPAVCAVDVRGGGPATRETDAMSPENLVQELDALVLSGGSVYGLSSADAVVAWLGAHDRGYQGLPMPGVPRSPIVPSACLYDLANGGDKRWGLTPPYQRLAAQAVQSVAPDFKLGTHGAGVGASAGGLKGGVGSASVVSGDGMTVGAIVAVNSVGSPVAPGGRAFWAGAFEMNREFGGLGPPQGLVEPDDWGQTKANPRARENTTIACIATDVALSRVELKRVAMMAQDGMARAIRPIHAPFDGDVVFAISTGAQEMAPGMPRPFVVARIGALAADTLSRAIARGVYEATAWPGSDIKTWRSLKSG